MLEFSFNHKEIKDFNYPHKQGKGQIKLTMSRQFSFLLKTAQGVHRFCSALKHALHFEQRFFLNDNYFNKSQIVNK